MTESEIYEKLDANNDEDILEHFPKKYLILKETPEAEIKTPGKDVVLFGVINNIKTLRGPFSIIRFIINSYNKELHCIVYNQPFYSKILKNNSKFLLITKYKEKTDSYVVKSIFPEHSEFLESKIKPIYSLPARVSQASFVKVVHKVLQKKYMYIFDKVPKVFVEKYRLEPRHKAFEDVHFPTSEENLNRGLRVFKYEEALKYCLQTAIIKSTRKTLKKLTTEQIDITKVKEFINSLPFSLTRSQRISLKEIIDDLNDTKVMYRLLQGDVGTGKTLVAALTLYSNYLRGGQGVLLAPTQILASQHYESLSKLFKNTDLKITLLTSKAKITERREKIKQISDNQVNIIIGTHSVLSDQINYANLTLAIIDEQQNFGVAQRNALISKGINTDLLMMSATPIPRTLSKVINSDLDISLLEDFPNLKRDVKTKVVQSIDPLIDRAIERALAIKRQVFIVAPKIIETEKGNKVAVETIYTQMLQKFGEDNIALLHGKMKEEERNLIYADFASGKKLILVATSIIEVGIDVQKACLMIIYSATCFGLSSLHQLRGRIGRSGDPSLALLIHDDEDDEQGLESLKYLAEHDDGALIAQYDLKIRGAGSLTGTNQSGESDLQVANFVLDHNIFEQAINDSKYIIDNLDVAQFKDYYNDVLKEITSFNID